MHADTDNPNLNRPFGPRPAINPVGTLDIGGQQVDHLLIVKAFADDLGLVELAPHRIFRACLLGLYRCSQYGKSRKFTAVRHHR
jgi:hypothetical protein